MMNNIASLAKCFGALTLVTSIGFISVSTAQEAGAETASAYCYSTQNTQMVVAIASNPKLPDIKSSLESAIYVLNNLAQLRGNTPDAALTKRVDALITNAEKFKALLSQMKAAYKTSAYAADKPNFMARLTALSNSGDAAANSFTRALSDSICKSFDRSKVDTLNFASALVPKYGQKEQGIKLSVLQAVERVYPTIKVISYKKDTSGHIVKVQIHQVISGTTFCNNLTFADPTGSSFQNPTPC